MKYKVIYCLLLPAIPTAILILFSVFLSDKWKSLSAQGKELLTDRAFTSNILYIVMSIFLLLLAFFIYYHCALAECIRSLRANRARVTPEPSPVRMSTILHREDQPADD